MNKVSIKNNNIDLPQWDLTYLYKSPKDKKMFADLLLLDNLVKNFRSYKNKVASLNNSDFGNAIKEFEKITDLSGRISSYAQLFHAQDLLDTERSEFYQNTIDKLTKISSEIIFFSLEINSLNDAKINYFLGDEIVSQYESWIKDLRVFKNHELSDDLERLINEKTLVGRNSWIRLFDEIEANISCEVNGEKLSIYKYF